MIIKKTYIPAKPRNEKLIGTGGMAGGISSSQVGAIDANSHTHSNKPVIDQLTQADINVLAKLSLVDDNLRIDANTYSTGNLSAFGFEEEQGGGGGSMNMMQDWSTSVETENYYLPAKLAVPFYNDTIDRLSTLEAGEGGQVIVDWEAITGKPTTFVPSAHTHTFENLTSIPTTLSGYGITDAIQINSDNWANLRYTNFAYADRNLVQNGQGLIKLDGWFNIDADADKRYGTRLTILGMDTYDKTQLYLNGENGSIQYRKSWYNNTPWTALRTLWDSNNLSPATTNTTQSITGTKTFTSLLTANAGVQTNRVIFAAAGWSMIQVGSELQMQFNGVVKQRYTSTGDIIATAGVTAFY